MTWLKIKIALLVCLILLVGVAIAMAQKTGRKRVVASNTFTANLSDSDIPAGLKEALSKGVKTAVNSLGRQNGFLDNARVKIPLPSSMQKLEKGLRLAG